MSRSYYEWMEAKQQWHIDQGLRIASIPYPSDTIEYPIVYDRSSSNPFWQRRYEAARAQVGSSTILGNFDISETYQFIGSIAAAEETKELEFLRKFYPSNLPSSNDLTEKFNILLQSKERYDRLLKRIDTALHSNKKNMAPNMDSLYASYLHAELKDRMEKFRASFKGDTPLKSLEEKFNEEVDNAIVAAVARVANVETEDQIYGSGKDWQEINNIIQSDQYLRTEFIRNMRAAIGNKNFNNVLKEMYNQKKKLFKNRTTTILAKQLKLSSRTASIGGNVIENTMAALGQSIAGMAGSNDTMEYHVSGTAIHGEMVKTDLAFVFSAAADIDTQDIAKKLNDTLSANEGNLMGAQAQLESFYNEQKELLHELFTIFVNSKNYQLGSRARGQYDETYGGPLETLPSFLERAGIPVASAQEFLSTAYNTAAGAIRQGMRTEVMEKCTNALKAAAAKLMFDDYSTLGVESGNGIHLFLLSGKYVPSSVVFKMMAESMGEAYASSKATINLPESVDDPGPTGWKGLANGKSDADIKQAIWDHWQSEAQNARLTSNWSVTFSLKIKQILS